MLAYSAEHDAEPACRCAVDVNPGVLAPVLVEFF
jgi:hypothetical protein